MNLKILFFALAIVPWHSTALTASSKEKIPYIRSEQEYQVSGTVTNAANNEPIEGATVVVREQGFQRRPTNRVITLSISPTVTRSLRSPILDSSRNRLMWRDESKSMSRWLTR